MVYPRDARLHHSGPSASKAKTRSKQLDQHDDDDDSATVAPIKFTTDICPECKNRIGPADEEGAAFMRIECTEHGVGGVHMPCGLMRYKKVHRTNGKSETETTLKGRRPGAFGPCFHKSCTTRAQWFYVPSVPQQQQQQAPAAVPPVVASPPPPAPAVQQNGNGNNINKRKAFPAAVTILKRNSNNATSPPLSSTAASSPSSNTGYNNNDPRYSDFEEVEEAPRPPRNRTLSDMIFAHLGGKQQVPPRLRQKQQQQKQIRAAEQQAERSTRGTITWNTDEVSALKAKLLETNIVSDGGSNGKNHEKKKQSGQQEEWPALAPPPHLHPSTVTSTNMSVTSDNDDETCSCTSTNNNKDGRDDHHIELLSNDGEEDDLDIHSLLSFCSGDLPEDGEDGGGADEEEENRKRKQQHRSEDGGAWSIASTVVPPVPSPPSSSRTMDNNHRDPFLAAMPSSSFATDPFTATMPLFPSDPLWSVQSSQSSAPFAPGSSSSSASATWAQHQQHPTAAFGLFPHHLQHPGRSRDTRDEISLVAQRIVLTAQARTHPDSARELAAMTEHLVELVRSDYWAHHQQRQQQQHAYPFHCSTAAASSSATLSSVPPSISPSNIQQRQPFVSPRPHHQPAPVFASGF